MNPAHRKIFEKKYGHQEDSTASHTSSQGISEQQNTLPPAFTSPVYSAAPTQNVTAQNESLRSVLDQFNSSKLAIRTSSEYFPSTKQVQKSTSIPASFAIHPFPQLYSYEEFPLADFGTNQIVRCDECRTYVNPFTEFIEGGQRFKCNLCGMLNNTPKYYFCETDVSGNRQDKYERQELYCGTYDIKCGSDYMARPPIPPIYFFVIDVSQKGVENGSIDTLCNILTEFVTNDYFWGDVRTKIGFLVYDTNISIVNLHNKLKQPQIVTLTDIDNLTRLPIFDHLLVTLSESKDIVLKFIKALPAMYASTKDNGSNLFNAVRVSASILRRTGGRMYVFQSNSNLLQEPNMNVKPTGDNKKDNKGPTPLFPASSRFFELTPDMQQNFVSCNLFVFSKEYRNIVTIAELPRYLNGDLHYYPEGPERSYKFYYDLRNSLSREYTWESVFRVRISSGWKISQKYGNYSIKASGDLLSLPNVDGNKSIIYEVELDADVAKSNCFYLQTALLYTNSQGDRRLRVINYGVPLTTDINDIQNNIDSQQLTCYLLRKSLEFMYKNPNISQIKEDILARARKIYTEVSKSKKQEGLPESLSSFAMSMLGILKHPLFLENTWQGKPEADVATALRIKLNMTTVDETLLHFVPYLFAVHSLNEEDASYYDENGSFIYPQLLNLSMGSLSSGGVYLMDAGDALYMLVGSQVDPSVVYSIFSVNSVDQVEVLSEDIMYQNQEDPLVVKLSNLINELRNRKADGYAFLHIIREGEKTAEAFRFYARLIEDKMNIPNSYNLSYNDFLNVISKPVIGN